MGKLLDLRAKYVVSLRRRYLRHKEHLVMGAACALRRAGARGWFGLLGIRAPEAEAGLVQPHISLLLDLVSWPYSCWPDEGQVYGGNR